MAVVIRASRFAGDFAATVQYFLERDAIRTATRFIDAVERTIQMIGDFPEIGILFESTTRPHRKVRLRPIRGFRSYLIAFRQGESGLFILRICHGRQDLGTLLDE